MSIVKTNQGEVFVEMTGEGIPLVLVHADGSSGMEYQPVTERLARQHQVIVVDLPGCGRSPRRAFSSAYYKENAKAVVDVIKQLAQHERAWVVGNGGGAITALWASILYPENVSGVVADSFTEFIRPQDLQRLPSTDGQQDSEILRVLHRLHGDDWQVVLKELNRVLRAISEQARSVMDWRLAEVSCPVLITGSRKDDFLESLAPRLLAIAEQIPSAELLIYSQGSHPCMWNQKERFWTHALDFIRSFSLASQD